ncbi:hypothetical protein V8G54_037542 [Vigna mungo]|uniref:Methyltransferase n=1 Tax=Vigna mungo TaxID=3915 RepID=A0AAQ3RE71_VIGMU
MLLRERTGTLTTQPLKVPNEKIPNNIPSPLPCLLCEPFDTYPRTYDLLHAANLLSVEKKRCNVSSIMLEMDRILRPGGRAYIRDTLAIMDELIEIGNAMGWHVSLRDTSEGPHASYRVLVCDKRLRG